MTQEHYHDIQAHDLFDAVEEVIQVSHQQGATTIHSVVVGYNVWNAMLADLYTMDRLDTQVRRLDRRNGVVAYILGNKLLTSADSVIADPDGICVHGADTIIVASTFKWPHPWRTT